MFKLSCKKKSLEIPKPPYTPADHECDQIGFNAFMWRRDYNNHVTHLLYDIGSKGWEPIGTVKWKDYMESKRLLTS